MTQQICRECSHFIQHYTKLNNHDYRSINCGHCTFPQLKRRTPITAACKYFKEKPPVLVEDKKAKSQHERAVYQTMIDLLQKLLDDPTF